MYALFSWEHGRQKGGMNDFVHGGFGTILEAKDWYAKSYRALDSKVGNEFQIVNLRSMCVVESGHYDPIDEVFEPL